MSGGRISVIVPCYNDARYIGQTIDSILNQTRQAEEIIVVDDGSTDDSAAIVSGFGKAVRLLSQPNKGAPAARNAGLAAANGDLIAFLDGDDIWPEDSLAARLAVLHSAGVDFAFGNVRQCLGGAGPEARVLGPDQPGRLAGTMLIRRAVFETVGGFDETLDTAETIDWVARAADAGISEANCASLVLYRRIHGANMMLRNQNTNSNALGVLRATLARRRMAQQAQS